MSADGSETSKGFTADSAAAALTEACRAVGLPSAGARLMRLGENALFRLDGVPVVARVARSLDYLGAAGREVEVSRWLADSGLPAAQVLPDVDQPVVAAGHPVTFWRFIEGAGHLASYRDLGGLLRRLHDLPLPSGVEWPPFDVFGRSELRISKARGISDDDRAFLLDRLRELKADLSEVVFDSAPGPVHGDAHVQNLMVDRSGAVLLIDFENFSFDHPEWDLAVTATEHRFGWTTPEVYAGFCEAYGRDVRDWPGFATLRRISEFKMTTWLMQNVSENPDAAAEYARRIATLRDDSAPCDWRPF
ncbi:aminoglycoside phosphotransferase family protein [Streptacidiphilus sp. ASG 303]|uniref:phosphotransferase enzyme family protein n=1 Tax=Streptacidiphilus sp. ASG 303 TaxID=2896847 RepID=UPI001E3096A4|nr:aminoglycoside phosphotransferase family protein [Streptacidiphilus sp. ASG 303]MCD0485749.1 aminoglycoside phosphotransferase family protein [Streptacidiphilus sp. ASG 303]